VNGIHEVAGSIPASSTIPSHPASLVMPPRIQAQARTVADLHHAQARHYEDVKAVVEGPDCRLARTGVA
jgi:hypothetical protein